jgi:hypothetical protein
MTPTWQRIIKAGTGILEIAREREIYEPTDISDQVQVCADGTEWVDYSNKTGVELTLWYHGKSVGRIEMHPKALNHLEEIAQAFEEALEIWRKM